MVKGNNPKKLGQNFLADKSKIASVVKAAKISTKDTVVEIGPGKGAITTEILEQNPKRYIGIEKDSKLVERLNKFATNNLQPTTEVKIIEGDILEVLPAISKELGKYKLIGNIPFYLTGYLFRILEKIKNKPELIVFIIQDEVANRLVAKPPNMNILSASVRLWADPEYLQKVPSGAFAPRPEVDGAIVKIKPKKYDRDTSENYYKAVRALFAHPRKTVLNNLDLAETVKLSKNKLKTELERREIKPDFRPQDMTVDMIKKVAEMM